MTTARAVVLLLLSILASVCPGQAIAPDELKNCNVVWNSPSKDALGSMLIGNGDIGLNVWVEPSGDLVFLIGKTDAWDENMRLLKLGKVRVKFTPALNTGEGFKQELKLRDGVLEFRDAQMQVRVWVDANHPVIQVDAESLTDQPIEAIASFEVWRTTKRPLGGKEYSSTGFTSLPAYSFPDTILPAAPKRIGWYHRNVVSPWLASLRLQKTDAIAESQTDPLLNRTMGAILRGDNFASISDTELKTDKPARELSLRVHVLTQIADTAEQWIDTLEAQADAIDVKSIDDRLAAHKQWWAAFWNRSWIFAEGGDARAMPTNDHDWHVGEDTRGGNRFGGEITGPQVIGRALSGDEIAELAAVEVPRWDKLRQQPIAGALTVVAWINPAAGESGRILDKCTPSAADGFLLDTHPGLSLRWIVGRQIMTLPKCLTPGQWHHVAATFDAKTGGQRIYLDGKLVREYTGGDNETDATVVTRAYVLQRWVNACGGRGAFPIKFNGSIFVADNHFDADYRNWGGGYWFQNTRLPYWSMLHAGDFDLMRPLFEMYSKALPARKIATKNYYDHDGAFFPETMSFWGNYLDQGSLGYGVDRANMADGLTQNQHIRYYWQGGLELTAMMLRHYDYTQDETFLRQTVLPFAHQIVTFYDQHYKRDEHGKLVIYPGYALEDIWVCKNPTPEIAGLTANLTAMIELTDNDAHRKMYQRLLKAVPDYAMTEGPDGKMRIAPCEPGWKKRKNNSEKPELYPVFPYNLFGVWRDGLDLVRESWKYSRKTYGNMKPAGWSQDPIFLACLGMTGEAKDQIVWRSKLKYGPARFPAFWQPNFDWMPDQDHGGVNMTALQKMLIQCELPCNGRRIFLLPAWPKQWNVHFKLHAPFQTTVEVRYANGKITELHVTPESRRKDVVLSDEVLLDANP